MTTPRARATRTALFALLLLVFAVVVVGVAISVGDRADRHLSARLVDSSRAGCERTRLDRLALREFMLAAADAREASGDLSVARRYRVLAEGVEGRIVDCAEAFPLP